MVGSTWSWAAMVWEIRRSTISLGLKPASPILAIIVVTESLGSGTRRSGEGSEKLARPAINSRRGAPMQFDTPTAPANWMLYRQISICHTRIDKYANKSPKDTPCLIANGRWTSTISSIPLLASVIWKLRDAWPKTAVSTNGKPFQCRNVPL